MRIILTGTPGTGKTAVAARLAALAGGPLVDLNGFARSRKLFLKEKGAFGEKTVDVAKMGKLLAGELRGKKSFVVEGHLACEFSAPADAVVVLRCDPRVLEKRLKKRGYPEEKIRENVLAELLDYCLIKAEANYGKPKIIQVDSTRGTTAAAVFSKARRLRGDRVDWSRQLLDAKSLKRLVKE